MCSARILIQLVSFNYPTDYTSSPNSETCHSCSLGKIQKGTDVENHDHELDCEDCPILTYNPFLGSSACIPCQTNLKKTGEEECDECRPGKFEVAGSACRDCPKGWYNQLSKLKLCYECPIGFYDNLNNRSCTSCGRGKYGILAKQLDENASCTECDGGRYSDVDGYASTGDVPCDACLPGQWSDLRGASKENACKNCEAGKYSSVQGASSKSSCSDCNSGKYLDDVGSNHPEDCKDW